MEDLEGMSEEELTKLSEEWSNESGQEKVIKDLEEQGEERIKLLTGTQKYQFFIRLKYHWIGTSFHKSVYSFKDGTTKSSIVDKYRRLL